jgi:hypothetical protein
LFPDLPFFCEPPFEGDSRRLHATTSGLIAKRAGIWHDKERIELLAIDLFQELQEPKFCTVKLGCVGQKQNGLHLSSTTD